MKIPREAAEKFGLRRGRFDRMHIASYAAWHRRGMVSRVELISARPFPPRPICRSRANTATNKVPDKFTRIRSTPLDECQNVNTRDTEEPFLTRYRKGYFREWTNLCLLTRLVRFVCSWHGSILQITISWIIHFILIFPKAIDRFIFFIVIDFGFGAVRTFGWILNRLLDP